MISLVHNLSFVIPFPPDFVNHVRMPELIVTLVYETESKVVGGHVACGKFRMFIGSSLLALFSRKSQRSRLRLFKERKPGSIAHSLSRSWRHLKAGHEADPSAQGILGLICER